tara:strand:- start:184 stop:1236 length:1053 start_codon:yes stop_codon:yes gene_type:complete
MKPENCWSSILENDWHNLMVLCRALEGSVPTLTDWSPLLVLANRTMVSPALASALEGQLNIPAEVSDFLYHIAERTRSRNDRMREQLIEVVSALSAVGITPLLIKGAAFLAAEERLRPNRLSTDLDVLVPLHAAAQARDILQSIGYTAPHASAARPAGLSFERSSDVGEVDLHYRLRSFEDWPDFVKIAPFCSRIDLEGAEALLPSPTLQAAILIAHDQLQERDYWRGLIDLRHLVDLRAVFATYGPLDQSTLDAFFFSRRAKRALATQLQTYAKLFVAEFAFEPSSWADIQCKRRFYQIQRPRTRGLLTAATLLIDPPALLGRKRHLEAARERAQYLKRMFSGKKPVKV